MMRKVEGNQEVGFWYYCYRYSDFFETLEAISPSAMLLYEDGLGCVRVWSSGSIVNWARHRKVAPTHTHTISLSLSFFSSSARRARNVIISNNEATKHNTYALHALVHICAALRRSNSIDAEMEERERKNKRRQERSRAVAAVRCALAAHIFSSSSSSFSQRR